MREEDRIILERMVVMDSEKLTEQEWHKKQAIVNFNLTWDLIDKKDRTAEDDLLMIHAAHASRFHWGVVGTPIEFARGEWQVSRVYSLLNMAESALYHGELSLKYCTDNAISGFDLAFGYEAVARAYMIAGKRDRMDEYMKLAREAADLIEDEQDRNYFLSELESIAPQQ